MTITSNETGVWILEDIYKKTNAGYITYTGCNELWAWGYNVNGQLGQNDRTYRSSPVQIPGTTWNDIGAGGFHSLALKCI